MQLPQYPNVFLILGPAGLLLHREQKLQRHDRHGDAGKQLRLDRLFVGGSESEGFGHEQVDRNIERIAGAQGGEADFELGEHGGGDGFLDQQPRTGATDVALVEEDAVDDAFHGLVERRVVEDDVGRLAPEFEGEAFV